MITTWRDLVLAESSSVAERLEELPGRAAGIPRLQGPIFTKADVYRGATKLLAEATALLGVKKVDPYLRSMLPYLEDAVREVDLTARGRTITADGMLWFLTLARLSGYEIPEPVMTTALSWLDTISERQIPLLDDERTSLAWTALVFGKPGLFPKPEPPPWPEYLQAFPMRNAQGSEEWHYLYAYAAISIPAETGEIARELHKAIMQMAGIGL